MSEEGRKQLNIRVRSQHGEEVHFLIKPHTLMEKVAKVFADKIGVDVSTVRLTFDGNRIEGKQTAGDIGLEDDDVLDAMEWQVGGGYGM